jgi:hypothetical protein
LARLRAADVLTGMHGRVRVRVRVRARLRAADVLTGMHGECFY